ncbi:hypothetical protein SKAU_G00253560 [Synaphobranchus kaupii]|uniref:Uncharacterized protein n=1 Tax=Synaphobranchus kaupii TaxID=118154 RepID=A0A9Q1IR66_SYNKA|nr:hypothetical protein SKAU_G00253560 [Synaphobranchus kaupii]
MQQRTRGSGLRGQARGGVVPSGTFRGDDGALRYTRAVQVIRGNQMKSNRTQVRDELDWRAGAAGLRRISCV